MSVPLRESKLRVVSRREAVGAAYRREVLVLSTNAKPQSLLGTPFLQKERYANKEASYAERLVKRFGIVRSLSETTNDRSHL